MIWTTVTKDHVFVWHNGQLIYKRYRSRYQRSWLFPTEHHIPIQVG